MLPGKVFYTKETEHFINGENAISQSPFAESLLDFLYLDLSEPDKHIYFDAMAFDSPSDAKKKRLLVEAAALQKHLEALFSDVFDVLPAEKSMRDKLVEYFSSCDAANHFSLDDAIVANT